MGLWDADGERLVDCQYRTTLKCIIGQREFTLIKVREYRLALSSISGSVRQLARSLGGSAKIGYFLVGLALRPAFFLNRLPYVRPVRLFIDLAYQVIKLAVIFTANTCLLHSLTKDA